jgi:hypothetical protein
MLKSSSKRCPPVMRMFLMIAGSTTITRYFNVVLRIEMTPVEFHQQTEKMYHG